MAILANRIKIRNNVLELGKFIIYSIGKFFTIFLLVGSLCLLYFSVPKPASNMLLETVGRSLSVTSLLYGEVSHSFKWLNKRISYFKNLEATNLKLRLKIIRLQKISQINSDLYTENKSLRQLLNVVDEIRRDFITAKVVGVTKTPFSSYAILQSGSNDNVKVNDIVRGSSGLIGRISEVSGNYSTVTLIDDYNSRTPVITGKSKTKGIIAQQDNSLKIIYLEENNNVSIGETVYTSGDGQIFPKGIPVATIVKIVDNTAFIEAIEQLNKVEYVVIELNS